MNNFADDSFDSVDKNPEPQATSAETEGSTRADYDEPTQENTKARMIRRVIGGLLILGTSISLYWSRIPANFNVSETVRAMAVERGDRELDEPLAPGYRTVATTIYLAEQLLEKPGGYQSNDIMPMSRIPDNMRNWEYGYLVQLRFMAQGLRYELSRPGQQSGELPELREAEARFNFKHTRWLLPSAESQYREGIDFLDQYLETVNDPTTEGKYFTTRQDQVIKWLERQKMMLGTYASDLQRNVGEVTFDTGVSTEALPEGMDEVGADAEKEKPANSNEVSSFRERDDVFYQVRGGVYVLYHVMLAMRKDCEKLLNDSQSMGVMNRLINELESACNPMGSPMVLNGKEFGAVQNHSLVLGAHVAKAHLAVQELQKQLAGGGGR